MNIIKFLVIFGLIFSSNFANSGDENADEFEDDISSSDNEEEGNDLLQIISYKL